MPPIIDMVDIDIQGGEYPRPGYPVGDPKGKGLFAGNGTIQLLTQTTRRVHIGLHRGANDDKEIINQFLAYGWQMVHYYPRGSQSRGNNTEFGPVVMADGVLSFMNPSIVIAQKEREAQREAYR